MRMSSILSHSQCLIYSWQNNDLLGYEILSILFLSLSFCRHIYMMTWMTQILFFFSLWIFPFVHMGYFPLVRSRVFSFFRWFFPRTGVYIVFHLHNKGGRSRGAFILTLNDNKQQKELLTHMFFPYFFLLKINKNKNSNIAKAKSTEAILVVCN